MKSSNIRPFHALWGYTKGYRPLFVLNFLLLFAELLLSFVSPLVLSVTIDSVLGSIPLNSPWYFTWIVNLSGGISYVKTHIWVMSVLMVTMAALSGLLSFIRPTLLDSAAFSINERLFARFYNHLQRLPYSYLAKSNTGDLLQRATSDMHTIRKFYRSHCMDFFRTIFLVAVGIMLMASLNLPLTLIAVVPLPIIVAFSLYFVPKIDAEAEKYEKQDSRLYSVIQENITGKRVVQAFGRGNFERDKLHKQNEQFRHQHIAFNLKLRQLWLGLDVLAAMELTLVTVAGVIFTVNNRITIGQFTAFLAYARIFLGPVQDFGKVLSKITQTKVAVRRVEEVLNEPEEDISGGILAPPMTGNIVLENLHFSFGNTPLFTGLNLTIRSGETIAILGGTGSGKSTLAALLTRLYEPDSGRITIGGTDIRDIDRHYLRKRIGLMMQEPYLYSKTVQKNIGIRSAAYSDDEIHEAAKTACIHEDIIGFPDGYDTVIGERGVTLSGGQRQRVSIARSIIGSCDILIFDDTLSAVDTRTDHEIRSALKGAQETATTIIISHRISTLMEADRIAVLGNGIIQELGTHEELLTIPKGVYRRVYGIQTSQHIEGRQ